VTKSVAILGCGPAGLLVAHAANIMDWDFRIYSKKQQSQLFGAQYLHRVIPELDCGIPRVVDYTLNGTPEEYRHKVYGDDWDGTVSPEDYMENHHAWDIRKGYQNLWDTYEAEIWDMEILGGDVGWMFAEDMKLSRCDLVISTVPRKLWAQPGDTFESQKIWALGDGEYERVHLWRPPRFSVVCDGTDKHSWYRVSNIFGYCTMEWPYLGEFSTPPARGASIVEKPLRHYSTAASDFVHLGRYGAWQKGVLTTDAFYDALKVFADDSIK
jgi:hypothetical protein